jgi:hypothetical protein
MDWFPLRGREALVAVAVAVLAGALIAAMISATSGGGPQIVRPIAPSPQERPARPVQPAQAPGLFAPDSIWNARVDGKVPLAARSAPQVRRLARQADAAARAATGPFIAYRSFSTPLYVVPQSQPKVRVALDGGQFRGRDTLQRAFAAVPLPRNARPAPGTDGHLTVLQPSTDRMWEFFRLRREGGRWAASWGGAMQRVSESPGYYSERSWPGGRHTWGGTATSLPVIGGTILVSELLRGEIPHALALAVPDARGGVWAYPAQRSDGKTQDRNALPEGAHLRLDPRLDIEALELPPLTEMMARAAQRHGVVLRDQTARVPQFYVEDPAQFIAAHGYDPVKRLYGGLFPFELLDEFPWAHLQVIDAPLCSDLDSPCEPRD